MAPHSSALAWEIPWTGEPGGPQAAGRGVGQAERPRSLSGGAVTRALASWLGCFWPRLRAALSMGKRRGAVPPAALLLPPGWPLLCFGRSCCVVGMLGSRSCLGPPRRRLCSGGAGGLEGSSVVQSPPPCWVLGASWLCHCRLGAGLWVRQPLEVES